VTFNLRDFAVPVFDAFSSNTKINTSSTTIATTQFRNNGCVKHHLCTLAYANLQQRTTDTVVDTQQPATERKAGQKEEDSWEDHNKEAKTLLAEAEYDFRAS
jgi:hypothetical protein